MERSKVKNVIIVILLALDLALGGILAAEGISERKTDRQALENLVAVLESMDISVEDGALDSDDKAPLLKGKRDTAAELKVAESIIGKCTSEDRGGNILSCVGEGGTMDFRSSGDFEVQFNGSVTLSTLLSALKKIGVEPAIDKAADGIYTAEQCVDGIAVVNSSVSITVEDGKPAAMSGRWAVSSLDESGESDGADMATAVMRFAADSKSRDMGSVSIKNVSAGYFMAVQATGEISLEPVWCIETDCGTFRVNGISLKTESVT